MTDLTIVVIAKECLPGRVKTRLHPPLTLEQAAELAQAALDDTLETVGGLPARRRILFFDGTTPPPSADGFDVVPQPDGTLDERLAHIFDLVDGSVLLVGMDTPQLSRADVAPVVDSWPEEVDAFLGPANDGGFWALALRESRGDLVRGVPMSRDDTGATQVRRLEAEGLELGMLPELIDVDTIEDAREVGSVYPGGRFAAALIRSGHRERT